MMSLHSLIETLRQSAARRSPSGPAMNDASEDELPPLPRPMAADHPSQRRPHVTGETLMGFRPFSSLSVKLRRLLQTRLTRASFAPGDFLLRQGDVGNSLVLLIEGDVEISTRDEQNNRHVIDRSSGGEVLGEMALLTREPRTADAIAITPVRALLLAVDEFHRLAHQHPELTVVLSDLVATRLGAHERDVLVGKQLDGYRIRGRLGRGGMSVVYDAEQPGSGRRVALKMMSHRLVYDHEALAQFQYEADLIESFDHENIVRMLARFAAFHTYFIVMEFCEGQPLSEIIAQQGPLGEDQCRAVLGQITGALEFAHAAGVIHRDVKPANILVGRDGRVRLADFGLARPLAEAEHSSRRLIVGTPQYMAPEQLFGVEMDHRADYFSLGCVAWEMLTGTPLFTASSHRQLLLARMHWKSPRFDDVAVNASRPLREFVHQCLQTAPRRRIPDVALAQSWAAPWGV